MNKRATIAIGMALGMAWGVALLWIASHLFIPLTAGMALALAFFLPGLVAVAMIARLAQRRFFDDTIIDGHPLAPRSPAAIDRAVLANTVEQLALALCIWPLVTYISGPAVVLMLGLGFAIARILFWVGYHMAPPLRSFGFAGSFYPTVLAAFWAMSQVITGAFSLPF